MSAVVNSIEQGLMCFQCVFNLAIFYHANRMVGWPKLSLCESEAMFSTRNCCHCLTKYISNQTLQRFSGQLYSSCGQAWGYHRSSLSNRDRALLTCLVNWDPYFQQVFCDSIFHIFPTAAKKKRGGGGLSTHFQMMETLCNLLLTGLKVMRFCIC